ncbi:MAG: hypothetical protein KGY74_05240 [Candidatus Cloacimonetes bacterium]|nr:hypothetical protein [Candidatus Cloacimonadota bacterium]
MIGHSYKMGIKSQLTGSSGNSIKGILDGRIKLEQDLKSIFSKFDFLGEKAYVKDIPTGFLTIGEHWTMEEADNGNLVFYYNEQERYRIRQ